MPNWISIKFSALQKLQIDLETVTRGTFATKSVLREVGTGKTSDTSIVVS